MTRLARLGVILFVAIGALLLVGTAEANVKLPGEPTSCPWWRPCGDGATYGGNKRLPQGGYGVDARPVCERHDRCYKDPNTGRRVCDQRFLAELKCDCQNSTNPRRCKRAARFAYIMLRLFGRNDKT